MPEDTWPLIPDVKNLTIFINNQMQGNIEYGLLLDELRKAQKNPENIEDILSFLRSLLLVSVGGDVRGLSEQNLIDLEQAICAQIVSKLNVELPTQETPYHRLCSWMGSIDRKAPIEIFTTNYDLLIEQALEDLELPYFDGFVGSKRSFFDLRAVEDNLIPIHWSRLWKIHGSINWYQESITQNSEKPIKRVYRSSEVKADASHLIYPSHLKYEESRKMPYLALIDKLSSFIRKKSSLLVLSGYSFNDGHLNDTIINALKANPTAMVLGLMFGNYSTIEKDGTATENYPEAYKLAKKQHNLNIWTNDKAVIGTNLAEWGKSKNDDDPVLQSFVEQKKAIDNTNVQNSLVKLGDFAVLTNFLKVIIGNAEDDRNG